MDLKPGDVLAGRFEVVVKAGGGGMGAVYRATDRTSGEVVAVKVLRMPGEESVGRFQREAAVLAELRHSGIVRYVAHGLTARGSPYIALEWLEGEDLGRRLARSGLTLHQSVTLARTVADALGYAHSRGVVHRDIKPGNVFLRDGKPEQATILDFGIARTVEVGLTITGIMIGTPGYMAPEQARGVKDLDARADVFSLGCVLFHCITGQRAFQGEDAVAVLARVLFEEARRTREVAPDTPAALDDLVARMLSKEAAARPRNGVAVVQELAALGAMPDVLVSRRGLVTVPPNVLTTAGERRLVSVILVAPHGAHEPENTVQQSAWAKLEGVGPSLREAAVPFGAEVETLANGAVIATLTSAASATDQAARAARCAIAMREVAHGAPMVLATGRSVLTSRLPVGDVIDRAAALLRHHPPPEPSPDAHRPIRLDEATAGLLDGSFDVRGDASGLELRGVRDVVEATRTLMGRPYPCYGRERELATLMGIFEECVAEPTAQAVVITAPSGVGKSRVRYELVHKVKERGTPVTVWMTRGDPMSAGSPFGMIAPLVLQAAGVQEGEPLPARQKKLRARVGRHVATKHVQRVTEFLGELVGIPFPGEDSESLRAARHDAMLMGDQMRAAWIDFVLAEASTLPVLFIMEDLHWGDVPSVKFVDALLRDAKDRAVMVLAISRPEVDEIFPQLWSGRSVTSMRLGEMTKKAATRFAREMLGDAAPEEDVQRVVERAQGNAFYLEELIRSVAQGRGSELPETVLAMAQARIERLEPAARLVLRAASVFGETFWKGGVMALLGGKERSQDMTSEFAQLCDNELIFRRGEGKFPGETEYIFRHAMFRDAANAMLTDEDLALGHNLAAEWLERAGERNALVLAEHFERGGEPRRAVGWYHRAAEQALDGSDLEATLARCAKGVASGASGATYGAFRFLEAEAHNWRGEHASAEKAAREAMRRLEPGGVLWYGAAAEALVASGRLQTHAHLIDTVRTLMRTPHDGEASARRVTALARAVPVLLFAGHPEIAGQIAAELDHTGTTTDPIAVARTQEARAALAMVAGDDARYLDLVRAAIASFERVGAARNVCIASVNAGYASMKCGAYADAVRALSDALASAERTGLLYVMTAAKHNLGLALARMGRLDEASDVEKDAVRQAIAQGDPRIEGGSRLYLAMIHEERGELEDAEHEARTAMDAARAIPPTRAVACGVLAKVLLARGRNDEALEAASEAMGLLESLGGLEEGESLVRLVHAEALYATGDREGARIALEAAAQRLTERASKLRDPELRRSFLERVPENARTMRLLAQRASE
jgi:tetratricopeptide (TPR) repeat protein